MVRSLLALLWVALAAHADTVAYVASQTGAFGTLDLSTGVFSFAGNSAYTLDGLGELNGSLYGSVKYVSTQHGTLFSVNATNGAITPIGSDSGLIYQTFGSTLNGLYAVGYDPKAAKFSENLYSINATTGGATLVGALGLGLPDYFSLSTNSSLLYYAFDNSLYTLSTSTGVATLVGGLGTNPEMGALITEGGTLYGADNYYNTVDSISLTNGAATLGPASTVWSGKYGYTFGLAPLTAAPEPGSVAEFGLGSFVLALVVLRVCWKKACAAASK